MNEYKLYTALYGYTRNYRGIPNWLFTPVRRLIRRLASMRLPKYFYTHPVDIERPKKEHIVVSLTSFPARIDYVYLTVESLLRQTELPGKVILWLSKNQFHSEDEVPKRLRDLQNDIFSIQYVDGDIKSHKKYYYAFMLYPKETIITVDDDTIYPPCLIDQLVSASHSFPQSIIANISRTISYREDELDSYSKWKFSSPSSSNNNVQIGVGGVLYPPNSLYEDLLNLGLSQRLAPSADDLWLYAMARLKSTKIVKTSSKKLFLPVFIPHNQRLTSLNNGSGKNDEQISNIRSYYLGLGFSDPFGKE